MRSEGGEILQTHEEIEKELTNHFNLLLKESNNNKVKAIQNITKSIPRFISQEKNLNLMCQVSLNEVESIVKEMVVGKAPRPDGFTVDFF